MVLLLYYKGHHKWPTDDKSLADGTLHAMPCAPLFLSWTFDFYGAMASHAADGHRHCSPRGNQRGYTAYMSCHLRHVHHLHHLRGHFPRGASPGSLPNGPGTPSRAVLDLPPACLAGSFTGTSPGMPCRGPGLNFPGMPCRGPCLNFLGTPCRGPCSVPLPPELSKGLTLLALTTVIWPTRHEVLVPPEPECR